MTIVEELERSGKVRQHRRFLCRCKCGAEKVAFLNNLRAGRTRSCGCTYTAGAAGRAVVISQRKAQCLESDEGRICLTCGEWKTWDKFSNDRRRASGKMSNCMECGNWRTVQTYFGITRTEWEWLSREQNSVCALCGHPEERDARLSIDHDHECCGPDRGCKKCIRGLLCNHCNRMLGFVEKREANRLRFADYLERRPFVSVSAGLAEAVLQDVPDHG